jgi:hypothetical protein
MVNAGLRDRVNGWCTAFPIPEHKKNGGAKAPPLGFSLVISVAY